MIHQHLIHVQNMLREHGILISFAGKLSQSLIEEYGTAVKTYLENEDRPRNEVTVIFSIFIEQTQNINNYCSSRKISANYEKIAHSSIVTIGKAEDGYFVCSGNAVEKEDLKQLTSQIDSLVAMDKAELKKLYKEKLREETPDVSDGAGLGLIDIARKAGSLEYFVTELDEQLAFFTLKAVV
ncbi:SiaB family protein kinase [Paenibacillus sp. GCM10012303]|uniref:SiaB family protein kinase n=1 Tax=Paenibacillus sp. GCM10012303 TaxID=3317340 RepID=UPI0036119F15